MEMQEVLVGSGNLFDEVGALRAVQFKFEITWQLISRPAGQSAPGKARTRGGSADDGQPISEGIYRLVGSDGKRWGSRSLERTGIYSHRQPELATRDRARARLEAERFLEMALATTERTSQELAWEITDIEDATGNIEPA
jgi:hypothetical protein